MFREPLIEGSDDHECTFCGKLRTCGLCQTDHVAKWKIASLIWGVKYPLMGEYP